MCASTEICNLSLNSTLGSMSKPLTSGFRKRKLESERKPKTGIQQLWHNNAWDASDLISLFNDLTLFDDRIEQINGKDMIRQEFIDRIGKLYKPVLLKHEDWNGDEISTIERLEDKSLTKKMICDVEFSSIAKDDYQFPIFKNGLEEWQGSQRLLIDYEIVLHFQDSMHKYFTADLHPSFRSFEDRNLAIISLRYAFKHSENLKCGLIRYINTTLKKNVGETIFIDDSEYDSDTCLRNIDTPKKKRRKIMFNSSSL